MIEFLAEVAEWFASPDNWTGTRGIPNRLREHVTISVLATAVAAVIALPPAMWLAHIRRGGIIAVSAVNIGRAIPSFGLVGVMFPITLSIGFLTSPLGYWATLIALVLLAMPPMFVNAYTAVREVEPALVEAARGMGMSELSVLAQVELPLGLPLIMAGIRTAAVAVVATATLGAFVGFGALGDYIFRGLGQGAAGNVLKFVGGLMVAVLAILTELTLGWIERGVDPTDVRRPAQPAAPGAVAG